MDWISNSDKKPEKAGLYLVSGGGKIWICEFLYLGEKICGWSNPAMNPMVEAWMPLPKPYEKLLRQMDVASDRLKDLKEVIIESVNNSQAKHPVELFQELLVILYTIGYSDGQHYIEVREGSEDEMVRDALLRGDHIIYPTDSREKHDHE